MFLGAIVLKLAVTRGGSLPVSHGRLLHAAFLAAVQGDDANLSASMHDAINKAFAVSLLQIKSPIENMNYKLQQGSLAWWRICGLGAAGLQALQAFRKGMTLRIGAVEFVIADIYASSKAHPRAGIIAAEDLLQNARTEVNRVTLEFLTPASFRVYEQDYPFPLPELVFGSLAERWNNAAGEQVYDVGSVKQIAADYLIADRWQGNTKRVELSPKHGVTGFVGKFSYRLNLLPGEYRAMFMALAAFGEYSGVGRLTGQGMGQLRVSHN